MANIWYKLKTPLICLAPMDGVTDSAFRQLLVQIGKPHLMFTEFTNVQAIFSHDNTALDQHLKFSPVEKPPIAQIWGLIPELFKQATALLRQMGFDGVDLNFGCPDKSVIKKGACSALINDRTLAREIITATQAGAAGKLPVSFKTRIGFDKVDTQDWLKFLLSFSPAAITVHGRTAKQMSKVDNNWAEIRKAVTIRDQLKSKTLIIGNGDIINLKDAYQKIKDYHLDGIMIGRGVFHDPFIFNPKKSIQDLSRQQKIDLLLQHLKLFVNTWGDQKSFHILKRFFKIYIKDFPGALALRTQLMNTSSAKKVSTILKTI